MTAADVGRENLGLKPRGRTTMGSAESPRFSDCRLRTVTRIPRDQE